MNPPRISVTIPGKLMLAGEYSITENGIGIAVSKKINHQVHIRKLPTSTNTLHIHSNFLDKPITLKKTEINKSLTQHSVLQHSLQMNSELIDHDLEFRFDSDLSCPGMGSSTAMVLGCSIGIHALYDKPYDGREHLKKIVSAQRTRQKYASGYDVISQYYGGLLEFCGFDEEGLLRHQNLSSQNALNHHFHLYFGSRPSLSSKDIPQNMSWLKSHGKWEKLVETNQKITLATKTFLRSPENGSELFFLTKEFRDIFQGCPNENSKINSLLSGIDGCDTSWSFKSVGAGGEDGILLIGSKDSIEPAERVLQANQWQKSTRAMGDFKVEVVCDS